MQTTLPCGHRGPPSTSRKSLLIALKYSRDADS
jgi:hypothetical protein